MKVLLNALTGLIAALHLWFLTLEMFLWQTPLGAALTHCSVAAVDARCFMTSVQGAEVSPRHSDHQCASSRSSLW